jgi:hypothetical protein
MAAHGRHQSAENSTIAGRRASIAWSSAATVSGSQRMRRRASPAGASPDESAIQAAKT